MIVFFDEVKNDIKKTWMMINNVLKPNNCDKNGLLRSLILKVENIVMILIFLINSPFFLQLVAILLNHLVMWVMVIKPMIINHRI